MEDKIRMFFCRNEKKIEIALIVIFVFVFIFWFLPNAPYIITTPSMGVKQFDKLSSLVDEVHEQEQDVYRRYESDLITSKQKDFYIDRIEERYRKKYRKFCSAYGAIASEEFSDEMLELYLSNRSFDELVMQSIKVRFLTGSYGIGNISLNRDFFERAASIANVESIKFKFEVSKKGDWYLSNPDKVPQNSTREVEGKFYSSSGENVNYQKRTNTTTVSY